MTLLLVYEPASGFNTRRAVELAADVDLKSLSKADTYLYYKYPTASNRPLEALAGYEARKGPLTRL